MDRGSRFKLGAFLGRSASGEVFEGVDTATGQRLAIKAVDCRRFRSIEEVEAVQEEIALLGSLQHRHIVRLVDVQLTDSHIQLAMEHAGGGTLQQLLRSKEGGALTEPEALRIFLQIFRAVEYCHRRCVVHRDLKPENILLDARGEVKVADFGVASILTPFDGGVSTLAGTPEFMAPDLLLSTSCDGAKADLWSLGVMLYESLAGRVPFSGATLPAILRAAARNKYAPLPAGVSGECRDLVAALLRPDPARRITLERGLQHPWLRQGPGCSRQLSPVPSAEAAGVAGSRAGSVVVQSRPGSAARGSSQGGAGRLQSQDSTACQQRSSLSLLLPVAEEDGSLAALALAGSGSGSGERDAPPAGARGGRPRSPAAVPGKSSAGVPRRTSSNKPAGADPSSPARVPRSLSAHTSSSSIWAAATAVCAAEAAAARRASLSRPGSRGRA